MYGLVNKAIQELVLDRFGEETWERIKERAGVTVESFLTMETYPDEVTYALVGAASEEVNTPAEDLLIAFGEYWMMFTAETGYGPLLDVTGSTFDEFVSNLDEMHGRVGLQFPELVPPRFDCNREGDELELRYYSERPGLAPMVIGLLRGLGQRFEQDLSIELDPREEGVRDHDLFRIRPAA